MGKDIACKSQPQKMKTIDGKHEIIEDIGVSLKHLHLYHDYDLIMPPVINERRLDYSMGKDCNFPVHVGHGTYGDVFRIRFTDNRCSDTKVCVKEFSDGVSSRHDIIEEARKLLYLSDTGYVPICFGVVEFRNHETFSVNFGIVQEFVGDGLTLHKFLRSKPSISKSDWISIAFQLAHGLDKFHDKRVLLNDIKTNNIIMYSRPAGIRVKYIDFGLATYISGRKYSPQTEQLQKLRHLAPEVRKGYFTSPAADVYSLGWIMEQIHVFGGIKDLMLISHMCMRETPKLRLSAHATKLLIETVVDL